MDITKLFLAYYACRRHKRNTRSATLFEMNYRGKRSDWVGLPRNKSLFFASPGRGLPIGNLTSQVFANLYMHVLDIYVKNTLGIQYYGGYAPSAYG